MIKKIEAAVGRSVPRETLEKLTLYVRLLKSEAEQQNLVSAASLEQVWDRHIIDSGQLARFEQEAGGSWVDLGSGAGLPGIVIACLVEGPVALVEPRKLRAEFLGRVIQTLDLKARVVCAKAQQVTGQFDMIIARAVAPLPELLAMSAHLSTGKTRWILPKGRGALSELADAKKTWHGTFHVEQSVTDEDSSIIVGTEIRR